MDKDKAIRRALEHMTHPLDRILDEKKMTDAQMDKREKIVKSLKKKKDEFESRYGKDAKEVMYATATKMAMKEEDIEEVTSRTNYRARSPGVKPVTGIKLVLPKTSKMAEKIEMVLGGDDPVKLKKMNRLVIGREEDEKEYRLEFKSAASREKFRKMMNEELYNGHSVEDIKEAVAADPQGMVKGLSNKAKKEIADELNRMQLSGYGDYMASPKNVHKFRPADLMAAMIKIMKLESLDEEKSLFDISPTSNKWMKGKLRVGYNKSQKSGMPKEMFKKGQVIDLHPFDGDRFVGAKSPKDKGSYFFVAKRHVDAMNENVHLDEMKRSDAPFTVVAIQYNKVVGKAFGVLHDELEDKIQSMKEGKKDVKIRVTSKSGKIVHTESVQVDEAMAPFNPMGSGKRKPATNIGKDLRNQLQMTKPSEYSFSAPAADGGTFAVIPIKTSRPSSQAGVMMAIFDKRGKVSAYYGTHMDTDSAKKFAKKDGLIEDVQLGEEVIKARVAFFGRPNQNNSDMRDAKKKNMFVDAKDVDAAKGKMFDVTFNSRRQFNRFESEYDFLMVKVFEDVQLDETNFRFPQPGEDYGEFAMSINDPDSFSGSGPSRSELKKRSAEIERKFASVMRKHKRTKVGEVLDLLDKDGGTKLYKDSDIKQISKYLRKHKDNVRKVAHQMMIDYMEGDDYLAKKRIPIREERVPTYVIDRQSKKIVHGPTDTADAKLYLKKQIQPRKFMIRQIRGEAKKVGDTV